MNYFKFYKPFNMLSQFTDKFGRKTLSDVKIFPKNVYPIGRLDLDSEGLLLLSDDKIIVDKILNPNYEHEKEYYVQVEGNPSEENLFTLKDGVMIEGRKTLPSKVKILENQNPFPERIPPIRFRANIPTTWLSITIVEGKKRQVRKMTAAVGFPTLRLVRVRIGNIKLDDMKPGEARRLSPEEINELVS